MAADGVSSEYMSEEELIDRLLITDVHVCSRSEKVRTSLFLHSWPTKMFPLTRHQAMALLTNVEETKAKLKVLLAQPKLKSGLYDLLNKGEEYGQSFVKYRDTLNLMVEALFSEDFDSWVSNFRHGLRNCENATLSKPPQITQSILDYSSGQESRQSPRKYATTPQCKMPKKSRIYIALLNTLSMAVSANLWWIRISNFK